MNAPLIRKIDVETANVEHTREVLQREWLLTNGIGGYASGTVSGMVSRRYHGLLVAALPPPLGRVVMLNHLAEFLRLPEGRVIQIGGNDPPNALGDREGTHAVREFRLEEGIPWWVHEAEGYRIEKRVFLVHGQNTVHITYFLQKGSTGATLELRPSVAFRQHEYDVTEGSAQGWTISIEDQGYSVRAMGSEWPLRLRPVRPSKHAFRHEAGQEEEIEYEKEAERGYPSRGLLWSPGVFSFGLAVGGSATLTASSETWEQILALPPEEAFKSEKERRHRLLAAAPAEVREGAAAELVLAADQFIIKPTWRGQDEARAMALGDDVRTIIAGYHWFTDWGRDTMISLEGLTLVTGRQIEARWLLRTFAHYLKNGLIPNLFPEGEGTGLYHTADATLWFVHALDRYLANVEDNETLMHLLPKLEDIIAHHLQGTDFNIRVDSSDGLLSQGKEGYQLTWMDAKVGDWVVTPRRGKAVEINALWYNALRLVEGWVRTVKGDDAARFYAGHAQRCHDSFNRRFWSPSDGYLLDVVDGEKGDDAALRPNQVMAISLRHPVLERGHWEAVLQRVRRELLTPVGLRSLAPENPDFKSRYFGDLRDRDAAYHQGTVWAWLIGPFIDAWLKTYPEDHEETLKWLSGLMAHLDHACVGSISEIFDAQAPFTPRGCIAQAWSVAEVLRCWTKIQAQSEPPK